LILFWLYDPAFGDSDDEDMHLNNALGEDMDKVESILHGNAGDLGGYNELAVLPDKIASYLYLLYLWYLQHRALLDTMRKLRATGGTGHIVIFNTLKIGIRSTQTSSVFPLGHSPPKN
jgi:hypothetical protein